MTTNDLVLGYDTQPLDYLCLQWQGQSVGNPVTSRATIDDSISKAGFQRAIIELASLSVKPGDLHGTSDPSLLASAGIRMRCTPKSDRWRCQFRPA